MAKPVTLPKTFRIPSGRYDELVKKIYHLIHLETDIDYKFIFDNKETMTITQLIKYSNLTEGRIRTMATLSGLELRE